MIVALLFIQFYTRERNRSTSDFSDTCNVQFQRLFENKIMESKLPSGYKAKETIF